MGGVFFGAIVMGNHESRGPGFQSTPDVHICTRKSLKLH
jgi:hypothetical protein